MTHTMVTLITALLLSLAPFAGTQNERVAFEVASIKPNHSGGASYLRWPTGRFAATNVTVRTLLEFAFSAGAFPILKDQIVGEPDWVDIDSFDVDAKPEGAADKAEMQRMMQSLLEDRFHLKLHH